MADNKSGYNEKDIADLSPLSSDSLAIGETLTSWVTEKCDLWRNQYEDQYQTRFKEYYRIWRGEHSSVEQARK